MQQTNAESGIVGDSHTVLDPFSHFVFRIIRGNNV